MNPVTILIFNTLARRKSVNLPEVGSLRINHRPAQFKSKKLIAPPFNIVEYSSKATEDGVVITDLISQSSGKDMETAQRIYEKWLTESVDDTGAIQIEAVGSIKSGFFKIDPELQDTLNPMGVRPTSIQRNGGKSIYLFVILAIIIGAAISASVITILDRRKVDKFAIEQSVSQVQVATSALNGEEIISDTINIDELPSTPETTTPAASTPVITTQEVRAATSIATPPSGTNYYVVIGTYSTVENADKFITSAKQTDGTLSYNKLTLRNGKIMIYTSVWDSEQKATKNRALTSFSDAWVFKYSTK